MKFEAKKINIAGLKDNSAKTTTNRKEDKLYRSLKAVYLDKEKNKLIEIIDCRTYYSNTVCYCAVWLRGKAGYFSGGGNAGGYGYCKESTAIEKAVLSMGITYPYYVGGAGMGTAKDFLLVIAKKISGKRNVYLVESYG